MFKKKNDGEPKAPKEKQPGRLLPWLKGIPGAILGGLKSLIPEPKWVTDGFMCECCGGLHKAKDCPKDPCGFYKKSSLPKMRRGRKGKGAAATEPDATAEAA